MLCIYADLILVFMLLNSGSASCPSSKCDCKTHEELYLNDNYLSRIDGGAFYGIDTSLELLDIQHNRLSSARFLKTHNFSRLRELLLRDNLLSVINPDSLSQLPALESLVLDENRLGDNLKFLKEPSLRALTHLNLDANGIIHVNPEDFVHLTNLQSLLINRNKLMGLEFLRNPIFSKGISAASNGLQKVDTSIFTDKKFIKWIDLSSNQLTEAEFTASCSLANLEEIYLGSNQLSKLPDDAFQATSSLTILSLKDNMLSTLAGCILRKFYKRMELFDIANNPLQCNCSLVWLQQPHSIMTERQSKCANYRVASTNTFNTQSCHNPSLTCDGKLSNCLQATTIAPVIDFTDIHTSSRVENSILRGNNSQRNLPNKTIIGILIYSLIIFKQLNG